VLKKWGELGEKRKSVEKQDMTPKAKRELLTKKRRRKKRRTAKRFAMGITPN